MEIPNGCKDALGAKSFYNSNQHQPARTTICALTSLTFGYEFERKEEDSVDTFELTDRAEVWLDIA